VVAGQPRPHLHKLRGQGHASCGLALAGAAAQRPLTRCLQRGEARGARRQHSLHVGQRSWRGAGASSGRQWWRGRCVLRCCWQARRGSRQWSGSGGASPIAVPSTTSTTTTPSRPVMAWVAAAHTASAPPMLWPTSSVGTRALLLLLLLPNSCCHTATMSCVMVCMVASSRHTHTHTHTQALSARELLARCLAASQGAHTCIGCCSPLRTGLRRWRSWWRRGRAGPAPPRGTCSSTQPTSAHVTALATRGAGGTRQSSEAHAAAASALGTHCCLSCCATSDHVRPV
jgi:hypothetical protein